MIVLLLYIMGYVLTITVFSIMMDYEEPQEGISIYALLALAWPVCLSGLALMLLLAGILFILRPFRHFFRKIIGRRR